MKYLKKQQQQQYKNIFFKLKQENLFHAQNANKQSTVHTCTYIT